MVDMSVAVTLALYYRAKMAGRENVLRRLRQKVLKIKEYYGWTDEELEEKAKEWYERLTEVEDGQD